MKILELRFKNLNSLYGEWVIDFTHREYESSGIFVLTGPTGAGKSTVLDAICLALYGATPRLGNVTQNENEIMSSEAGECYAEVLFESQVGRFRCRWEQHRARKRSDGNLQNQKHEISDGDTGKVIETQKKKVTEIIEEKIGMNFDRFTRSTLLAQGSFDTFLKADDGQKSTVLEKITGTEIYSEISRGVHARRNEEQSKLKFLQEEVSGIAVLEPEKEQELQSDLKEKEKEEKTLVGQLTHIEKAIKWRSDVEDLEKEISNLTKEKIKLQSDIANFKPKRDKLDQAVKAASLDGSYATLTALRKQQSADQEELKNKKEELSELDLLVKEHAKARAVIASRRDKAKKDQKEAAPLIKSIRSLDQELAGQKEKGSEERKECATIEEQIEKNKESRNEKEIERTKAQKNLEIIEENLEKRAKDERLVSGLSGVTERLKTLFSEEKKIKLQESKLQKAEKDLERKAANFCTSVEEEKLCKEEYENTSQKVGQRESELEEMLGGQSLEKHRAERETLIREKDFLFKIKSFEEHRTQLEDGKPCPLCGSKNHPFAEGNAPVSDETEQKINSLTERIKKAEKQESVNRELEKEKTLAREKLSNSTMKKASADRAKKSAEEKCEELRDDLDTLQGSFAERKRGIFNELKPLGIVEIPNEGVSSLLESLTRRRDEWQRQVEQRKKIQKHIAAIAAEIGKLDTIIEVKDDDLAQSQKELEALEEKYATGSAERKKLYDDKSPDAEEQRLSKAIEDAEKAMEDADERESELSQALTAAKTSVNDLEKRIDQRKTGLEKTENSFSSELRAMTDFSNENQFCEARLTNEERKKLLGEAESLDKRQMGLKARQKDRKAQLEKKKKESITEDSLDELQSQREECNKSLTESRDCRVRLQNELEENTKVRKQIENKQNTVDAQKKECGRWEKLHKLVGSADGKKYRNFAQGLTLESLMSHANGQLKKMRDRYQLIRDGEQPLVLNVVDHDQASITRSTKNLSGGESFIVSLALALGLSEMASLKVRVDSLFLDEGFDTLDEEALDTVLGALSELQQTGRLIGVISHVSALKEGITTQTQISVTPLSGGRSALAGPGCSDR